MRLWRYELAGCKNFVCKLKITSVPITLTLPYYSRIIYVIKLSSIHSGKHTTFETSKARLLSNRCIFLKKISNEHRYGYGRINQSQLYVTKSHQISIHISPMLCWDKTVIKTFLHKKNNWASENLRLQGGATGHRSRSSHVSRHCVEYVCVDSMLVSIVQHRSRLWNHGVGTRHKHSAEVKWHSVAVTAEVERKQTWPVFLWVGRFLCECWGGYSMTYFGSFLSNKDMPVMFSCSN